VIVLAEKERKTENFIFSENNIFVSQKKEI